MEYVVDQIIIFAFLQCLFLITIFTFSRKRRKDINTYLLILVIALFIGLVGKIGANLLNWQRQVKGLAEFSTLLFGPTIYFFVLSMFSKKGFSKKDLFHYIPALVYSMIILFYYMLPSNEIIVSRIQSGVFFRFVGIMVGFSLIFNISYYLLTIKKFIEFKSLLESEVSFVTNINFLRNFLIAIGTCLFIWLLIYFLSVGEEMTLEIIAREFVWLAIALIILFLSYYQMVSPSLFLLQETSKESKYALSKFTQEDLDKMKIKLEHLMISKRPYLNSKLLKSELADLMEINAPELSRLLNERIGMSFFEFINYYRIQEFIRLAQSSLVEQKTLLGLAQEAGFNSKSTFNKSFKELMGCPPSEYLKKIK